MPKKLKPKRIAKMNPVGASIFACSCPRTSGDQTESRPKWIRRASQAALRIPPHVPKTQNRREPSEISLVTVRQNPVTCDRKDQTKKKPAKIDLQAQLWFHIVAIPVR